MKKIIGAALTASMAFFVNNTMAEVRNITDGPRQEEARPTTSRYSKPNEAYRYTNYDREEYAFQKISQDYTSEPTLEAIAIDTHTSIPTIPATIVAPEPSLVAPVGEAGANDNSALEGALGLDKLEKMFNIIDSNADGSISKGEFIDFHDKVMRKKAERMENKLQTPKSAPIFNKPMGRVDLP